MQFDVFTNKNPTSRGRFPYLLDLQAELLAELDTRVIVPLAPRDLFEGKIVTRLMPILEVNGQQVVAVLPQMAGVSKRELGDCVGNVAPARAELIGALDLLFTGI